jgi:hypothetical protein
MVVEKERICRSCCRPFDVDLRRADQETQSREPEVLWFCCADCQSRPAPAVYRYICPDGRSYVGACPDHRTRNQNGIQRSNLWLLAAFEQHPPETWRYEVLERMRPGCSLQELREEEQHHIERLRSWDPRVGFNMTPAVWRDGPMARAARRFMSERTIRHNAMWKQWEKNSQEEGQP